MTDKKPYRRKKEGIVVSDKANKTVVVLVERLKMHHLYKKQYKVSKKYKTHDEKNEYKVGDEVIIEETKPISKDKRWKVVEKIQNSKNQNNKQKSKNDN